jgi:acyl dehydratase
MVERARTGAPYVDKPLSRRVFEVTETSLSSYYRGLALAPRPDGRVPSMIAGGVESEYFGEIAFPDPVGHLWLRQEWELSAPFVRGQTYTAGGRIRDIYPRRDREVVCYEVALRDASGAVAALSRHHQSFLRESPAGGQVAFRDPAKKPAAGSFAAPDGERFGGLERTITLEMCAAFFHGDANYHTDRAASRELGFHDVVVGGHMTLAYAAHILEERFGSAWWTGGRLAVKFTNPTWPGDTLCARGVVTGPLPADPERVGARVWLAKRDGTIVLVGEASIRA